MDKEKFHIDTNGLSEIQIQDYLDGRLSPIQMNLVEKYLLDHPFDYEAFEGFEENHENHDIPLEVMNLQRSISKKIQSKPVFWKNYRSIAAGIAFLIIGSVIAFTVNRLISVNKDISLNESQEKTEQIADKKESILMYTDSVEKSEITKSAIVKNESNAKKSKPTITTSSKIDKAVSNHVQNKLLDEGITSEVAEIDFEEENATNTIEKAQDSDLAAVRRQSKQIETSREEVNRVLKKVTKGPDVVYGKVSTEAGFPIQGATLYQEGNTIGTVTDANGEYKIDLDDSLESPIIHVGMVGYVDDAIMIGEKKEYNIKLREDQLALGEIVIQSKSAKTSLFRKINPTAGFENFRTYIEENTIYPDEANSNTIKGKVVVEFYIETDGKLSNFRIIKSLGYGCDVEAIRVIKEGPSWTPALKNGVLVRDKIRVKVPFGE